jgi:Tol biopolymer transport system component
MFQRKNARPAAAGLFMLVAPLAGCPGFDVGPAPPAFDGQLTDGVTTVASRDSAGTLQFIDNGVPNISANGRVTAYEVRGGSIQEIFVHDRDTGLTELVSVGPGGAPGSSISFTPSLSADGRLVAFESWSDTLAPGDANGSGDVYVRDREAGMTVRASVSTDGAEGDGISDSPALAAGGRFVAFVSGSANLVPSDTNSRADVFVRDLELNQTTRVSVSSTGAQIEIPLGLASTPTCAISADGRYVAFNTLGAQLVPDDTNDAEDVFVHDRLTGRTVRISVDASGSQGDGDSRSPAISADGRRVAFISSAEILAPGAAQAPTDVYLHDRDADGNGVFDETCAGCRSTLRLPLDTVQTIEPGIVVEVAISGDGDTVAYSRSFTGPESFFPQAPLYFDPDVYVFDRLSGQTRRVAADQPGVRFEGDVIGLFPVTRQVVDRTERPSLSFDGRFVAYLGMLNYSFSAAPEAIFVEDLGP